MKHFSKVTDRNTCDITQDCTNVSHKFYVAIMLLIIAKIS